MKKNILATLLTILLAATSNAQAGVIIATADVNIDYANNNAFFNNVFTNQNVIGLNSSVDPWSLDNWDTRATQRAASYSQSTILSSASLMGADWLIAASGSSYNNSTLQVIKDFLIGGGNLWVGGESVLGSPFEPANQLLSYLGSSMELTRTGTWQHNTAANTGLDSYTSGTTIFSGEYQSTIAGGVSLYGNGGNSVVSIDRTTFFGSRTTQVPEPSSLALFALVVIGLGCSRKNKNNH
jgi:hypothetical protein